MRKRHVGDVLFVTEKFSPRIRRRDADASLGQQYPDETKRNANLLAGNELNIEEWKPLVVDPGEADFDTHLARVRQRFVKNHVLNAMRIGGEVVRNFVGPLPK